MKHVVVVTSTSIALAIASSAYAADINAPYAAPVPYSWSGFYIGADAGGAWAHSHGRWDPMDNLDKPN
ncbi:MAG: hypothetical protein J2P54_20610, partial [Bradyrhizobiaceae bacterium]|nr:hypothetical protein [Bradyrhizobiaceae bacterium]